MLKPYRKEIFDSFVQNHGVTLLDSEIDGLERTVMASIIEEAGAGVMRIVAERLRQVVGEGWSGDHDDGHVGGELRNAAIAYAMACDPRAGENAASVFPSCWGPGCFKPADDPIRNLVRAGALIAAEIDRLTRLKRCPA